MIDHSILRPELTRDDVLEACRIAREPIKAAGGVRTLDDALAVRAVGATRFGATATVAILTEARQRAAEGRL